MRVYKGRSCRCYRASYRTRRGSPGDSWRRLTSSAKPTHGRFSVAFHFVLENQRLRIEPVLVPTRSCRRRQIKTSPTKFVPKKEIDRVSRTSAQYGTCEHVSFILKGRFLIIVLLKRVSTVDR